MEEIKKISQEAIETFINGHDPMERIVNLLYNYSDDYVTVVYRNEKDQKCKRNEKFYPFCWATLSACQKLCAGNREELKRLMARFKIGVKKLSNVNIEGEVRHEFDDGYLFMFFAKSPMSYKDFLSFFKIAGNPIYSKSKEENSTQTKSESHQYLIVTPQEQFLIATGKRFFKGYDDYDQVLKMTFDLETTGVDLRYDKIIQIGIRMNRPFPACPNGFEKIITITGETEEDRAACELWAIEQMFKMIHTFQPDIITAHNGENFDWNMIINACERLGTSISEVSSKYFNGESIRKEERESILKLGGEIETFYQTIVPGITVTDSLHAVRRAQALDSNMLEANLKYVTKYSKLNKPNRVYTPGEKISQIWADKEEHYAFNEENGDWYFYDPNAEASNTEFKHGKEGDKAFIMYTRNYIADGYELKSGQYIVERYLFDDLYECDKVEHRYNTPNFLICKMLPVPYKKCTTMGTAGQWKALMLAWSYENNLAVPMFGESKSFTGGLSRLLRVGFVDDVAKFDYNSLYPSIILTWAISDSTDLMKTMLHFLEHVLSQREKYKKLKKVAGNKAGAIKDKLQNHDYATPEEGKALQLEMMKWKQEESFNDKKQLPLKILGNSFFGSYGAPNVFPFGSLKCAEQTTCTGRQCLRLMISHFSNLGYAPIVGDTDGFNFKLPSKDKFRYTEEHPYISTGLSRETKKDKAYTGFKADVAEFNDMYMKDFHYSPDAVNKMGLGIDEIVDATINFSRKNYSDYFPENPYPDDVKMVGNTIKSKKMPEYIAKFLAKGIRLLLQGKGQDFLEEYYNYIDKIYNYKIPLRDIASKGKIKKSLAEYKKDVQTITKAGRPKSRQAWYELAIKNNLSVSNGDTIYYVNNGTTKSHSDAKKVQRYLINEYTPEGEIKKEITKDIDKAWTKYRKEMKDAGKKVEITKTSFIKENFPSAWLEEEIVLNCVLVPRDIIEKEEDTFCSDVNEEMEYNVVKYIDQFNKRITPLLVCFSKQIRGQILIDNPSNRPYFTEEQCKLSSGEPNKPTDQDTYEQLMTMEDKEIKFWAKYDLVPPFIEECGMGKWEDIKSDYLRRMKEEEELGINKEREAYDEILSNLSEEEIDEFYNEGELPSALLKIVELDPISNALVSKKFPNVIIGRLSDINYELLENNETDDE